jgi:hypothetical protein
MTSFVLFMVSMVIWFVEFSRGDTKFERFLPKNQRNQHAQTNFLNLSNYRSGKLKLGIILEKKGI